MRTARGIERSARRDEGCHDGSQWDRLYFRRGGMFRRVVAHRDVQLWRSKSMLVLSRKKNERIIIAHDIEITVVEIRGDKVRLGIEAPKHIPVHREEVENAINARREEAA